MSWCDCESCEESREARRKEHKAEVERQVQWRREALVQQTVDILMDSAEVIREMQVPANYLRWKFERLIRSVVKAAK